MSKAGFQLWCQLTGSLPRKSVLLYPVRDDCMLLLQKRVLPASDSTQQASNCMAQDG